jgi:hypothetical protein
VTRSRACATTKDPEGELRAAQGDARRLCKRGQEVGLQLERGQAESPLASLFAQVSQDAEKPTLHVLLLAESEALLAQSLEWLGCGGAEVGSARALPGTAPCSLTPLLLEAVDLEEDGPELSQGQDLLLLVGGVEASWPAELTELTEDLALVQPVIALEDGADLPRRGWWRERGLVGEASLLSAIQLSGSAPPEQPPWLSKDRDPIRRASLARIAAKLERGAELVADRLQLDQRQLQQRVAGLDRREKTLDTGRVRDPRGKTAPLKELIEKQLGELESALADSNERSLLETGSVTSAITAAVFHIQSEDLSEEAGDRSIKLCLSPGAVLRLTESVQKALRQRLSEDTQLIQAHLNRLEEVLHGATAQAFGESVPWAPAAFDEELLWERLTRVISLEVRYKGEIPKRGMMARLAEGRRKVFMVLMSVSLMGGIFGGISRRGRMMGIMMLVFFVGAFAWTFISWRGEDADRLEQELQKARDALGSEMKRILREAQREKQQKIKEHLSEVKKAGVRQVEEQGKVVGGAQSQVHDSEREQLRSTRKQNDQRLRDLGNKSRDVDRLIKDAGDLRRKVKNALRDLARATESARS